jgi:hypothetical protein
MAWAGTEAQTDSQAVDKVARGKHCSTHEVRPSHFSVKGRPETKDPSMWHRIIKELDSQLRVAHAQCGFQVVGSTSPPPKEYATCRHSTWLRKTMVIVAPWHPDDRTPQASSHHPWLGLGAFYTWPAVAIARTAPANFCLNGEKHP